MGIWTDTRTRIMIFLRMFMVATCAMISEHVRPDGDRSRTRNDLRVLLGMKAIRRYQPKIIDPLSNGSAPPVYTPTCEGCSMLAAMTGKSEYLLNVEVNFNSSWMAINHMICESALGVTIHRAFEMEPLAKLTSLHFEHDVIDPTETLPERRFFLYTNCDGRIRFCPDMAFESTLKNGERLASYVEYETGSDTPARVAAKKHKGVAEFGSRALFARQFPQAHDFKLLAFTPNPGWRDALRKEMRNKPGKQFWRFCAMTEVSPTSLLRTPIWYTVDGGPFAFLVGQPTRPPGEDGRVLVAGGGLEHA